MVECVFTLDYEIYGNGKGSLEELVYRPADGLMRIFDAAAVKLVLFVEVAELEKIQGWGADSMIRDVIAQLRHFYAGGHEIALHLHPQWCNARWEGERWQLDYDEYNLCTLTPLRISEIVDRAIAWMREVLTDPRFTPVSFRAGNWLFQPARVAAQVLASRGITIDSSVFKGGLQRQHGLDYRAAKRNGWHWRFCDDVNVADPSGAMLELPIYSEMVPFWRMLTRKRLGLHQRTSGPPPRAKSAEHTSWPFGRWRDYLRLRYPRKFDFSRMSLTELTAIMEQVILHDHATPEQFKPVVSIGHTKDLIDLETVEVFLIWLKERSIPVTTLAAASQRCETAVRGQSSAPAQFVS